MLWTGGSVKQNHTVSITGLGVPLRVNDNPLVIKRSLSKSLRSLVMHGKPLHSTANAGAWEKHGKQQYRANVTFPRLFFSSQNQGFRQASTEGAEGREHSCCCQLERRRGILVNAEVSLDELQLRQTVLFLHFGCQLNNRHAEEELTNFICSIKKSFLPTGTSASSWLFIWVQFVIPINQQTICFLLGCVIFLTWQHPLLLLNTGLFQVSDFPFSLRFTLLDLHTQGKCFPRTGLGVIPECRSIHFRWKYK